MTTGTENTLCITVLKSNAIINTMLHKKAKRLKLLSNLTLRKELSWDKFLWGINSNYAYNWVKNNEKYDKLNVLQNRSWRRHHSQIVALWRHMVQRSGSTMVQVMACRIKTGSGGVCCHNARGRVRNRKSNPDGVAGGIWRTVRTNPSALWQQTPTARS